MSQHELNSARQPLLNTTPTSIRNATFFLKPFYIAEASMNFFGGTISTSHQTSHIIFHPRLIILSSSDPLQPSNPLRHVHPKTNLPPHAHNNTLNNFHPTSPMARWPHLRPLRPSPHSLPVHRRRARKTGVIHHASHGRGISHRRHGFTDGYGGQWSARTARG